MYLILNENSRYFNGKQAENINQILTEADKNESWFRQRLSAEGAKPESNNRWKSDRRSRMFVSKYQGLV